MAEAVDISPEARLERIAKHELFIMYAELRRIIHHETHGQVQARELTVMCSAMEARLARKLDIAETTLVGKLVDVADPERLFKTGNGLAE